jgi:nucleotide-binding universal stress UspA family protein
MSLAPFDTPNHPITTERPAALRILVVVDGTERTTALLHWVAVLAPHHPEAEAVVLNVQPVPATGRLRGYGSFKREQIRGRLMDDIGKRIVAAAGRRLDQAGMRYTSRIEFGRVAATALRCAREEGCGLIAIGEPAPGDFRRWLARVTSLVIGSAAGRIVQLAEVPVVVVR